MKYTFNFSAIIVQYILISVIILEIAGIGFLFAFATQTLQAKNTETDHAHSDAELAALNISYLKQLKTKLASDHDIITKTAKIVSDSQSYTFQDQFIDDLTSYANYAKVRIDNIDFGTKPGDPPPTASSASATKLKRTLVIVQIANDTPYNSILLFIRSIEMNLTKMQLSKVSFSPKKGDPEITSGPRIEIEVYLR